jgi:hypothetical protein
MKKELLANIIGEEEEHPGTGGFLVREQGWHLRESRG